MKYKYFLTGATGLIGQPLAMRLAEEGHQVHALVRSPAKAKAIQHENIKTFQGDLTDLKSIAAALKGCDRAFHLAAYAKAWAPDPVAFDKINYHAALELLDIAEREGIERVVVTSTGGVLGHSQNGRLVNEESRADPGQMTQYERSKAKLEEAIQEKVKQGASIVIVNPARVYGPGPLTDSNGEVMVMQRYLQGNFRFLPGDGSSTGSYAFLDDVVNGHILAMEKGRPGERYILGGENASFREFFDTVGRVAGKKYRMFPFPIPLLMGFARLQLFLADNFGRYPLITPELVRKYSKHWDFSTEKARKELGYDFISLEEGVRRTLAWMEKEGLV